MKPSVVKVKSIEYVEDCSEVCDLSIADNHNLFVSSKITENSVLAHNCLEENLHELASVCGDSHGYYSLGNLCIQYGFNGYISGKFGKEDRAGISNSSLSTPGLIEYCAYDVGVLHGIYEQQLIRAKIKKHDKYENVVKYLIGDTIQTFSTMNVNGVLVDKKYLWWLSSSSSPINGEVIKMEEEILSSKEVSEAEKIIRKNNKIPSTGLFGAVKSKIFNLRKKVHLKTLFFGVLKLEPINVGVGGPALDKTFQEEYQEVPLVSAYTSLVKAKKIRDAFVKSLIKIMSKSDDAKVDSRIRPSFNYLRVVTGRTSANNPNLQQIPSRGKLSKYIKRVFIARPGSIFIKVDYCVTGDALIPTEKGLLRLDSLIKGKPEINKVYSLNLNMASIEGKNKAIFWKYLGIKPTLKVITETGNNVSCTPDHKIYVLRENTLQYVEAQNLKTTDYLVLPKIKVVNKNKLYLNLSQPEEFKNSNNKTGFTNIFEERGNFFYRIVTPTGKIHKYGFKSHAEANAARLAHCESLGLFTGNASFKQLSKPEFMTPDLAFFIGAIIADGFYQKHKRYNITQFDTTNLKFIKRVRECIQNVFGHEATIETRKTKGKNIKIHGVESTVNYDLYTLRIKSNLLSSWLDELGVHSQEGKLNGKTSSHYHQVPWCILQADEESQLAFMAAIFEGDGYIKGARINLCSSVSKKLILQLQILLNSHGFISKIFERRGEKSKLFELHLPLQSSQKLNVAFSKYLVSKFVPEKEQERASRIGSITGKSDENYYFVKVKKIVKGKNKKVYDISMKDQSRHAFVANGIAVSNCAHEVRGWSLISGDKNVAAAFQKGIDLYAEYVKNPTPENLKKFEEEGDIHIINSAYFFGLKVSEVTKEIRQSVKGVTFGLIYGRSAKSLSVQLNKSLDEVNDIIEKFFKRFKVAANWLLEIEKFARKNYYVEAPTGLRRHLWPYLLPKTKEKEKQWNGIAAACDRRARNCITGEHVITTSLGNRQIKELVGKKFKVLVSDGSYQENKGCVSRGIKKIVKVTLHDGTILRGTPDHEVYVLNKDFSYSKKPMSELQGEYVVKMPPESIAEAKQFKGIQTGFKEYPILDAKFARFLGHIFAEGNVKGNSITYANNDQEVMNDYIHLVNKLFNAYPKVETNNTNCKLCRFSNKELAQMLRKEGIGQKQPERIVPPFLFRASAKVIGNFLKAVFEGDGYNRGKGVGIELSTEKGIQGLKQLLQGLGIHSSYAFRDYESPEQREIQLKRKSLGEIPHMRNSHILAIYGKDLDVFAEKVGFISSRKSELLEPKVGKLRYESAHETLPMIDELIMYAKNNSTPSKGGVVKYNGNTIKLYTTTCKSDRKKLEKPEFIKSMGIVYGKKIEKNLKVLAKQDQKVKHEYIKVVSVEEDGEEEVFDILSVEKFEHFIANSCVISNSPIQGLGSGIGYSAARYLETWTFDRFKEEALKSGELPIRNQNMVHDSTELEVNYSHIIYATEMIRESLTKGVQSKCEKLFGMNFPVDLSIDMEIGATLDTVQKWDGSIQELHRILKETFEYQKNELKYELDVEEELEKVFKGYISSELLNQAKNGYFTEAKKYGILKRKE